jgi:hypothetical protein
MQKYLTFSTIAFTPTLNKESVNVPAINNGSMKTNLSVAKVAKPFSIGSGVPMGSCPPPMMILQNCLMENRRKSDGKGDGFLELSDFEDEVCDRRAKSGGTSPTLAGVSACGLGRLALATSNFFRSYS